MFRWTDFGGFLVCCQIGHPYLNDVENNYVAISLMLSLENAQIDWTKRGEPRNELKFLPRVRAQDAFSVKHPLMNDRYLLVRRGQKLDEGHNGTTRVAIAFCRLRQWIMRATRESGGTTKQLVWKSYGLWSGKSKSELELQQSCV